MCLVFVCRVVENVFVCLCNSKDRVTKQHLLILNMATKIHHIVFAQVCCCWLKQVLFVYRNLLCVRSSVLRGFFRNVSVCLSDFLNYTDLVLTLTNKTLFLVSFCSGLPCYTASVHITSFWIFALSYSCFFYGI